MDNAAFEFAFVQTGIAVDSTLAGPIISEILFTDPSSPPIDSIGFTPFSVFLPSGSFDDVFAAVSADGSTANFVPIPSTAWLFTCGLIGLMGLRKKRQR